MIHQVFDVTVRSLIVGWLAVAEQNQLGGGVAGFQLRDLIHITNTGVADALMAINQMLFSQQQPGFVHGFSNWCAAIGGKGVQGGNKFVFILLARLHRHRDIAPVTAIKAHQRQVHILWQGFNGIDGRFTQNLDTGFLTAAAVLSNVVKVIA